MKSIDNWYAEYAESHQNVLNQKIHFICVPLIYFSIVGLFMSIPNGLLTELTGREDLMLNNWALVALILPMIFYLRLSFQVFVRMLLFSLLCIVGNYLLAEQLPLLWTSIIVFALAWIGQFYGHHVEGKKPSFLKDLQFLLIGPAWVFEKVQRNLKA
ncbi:MAG: DUF962 domain-containing protein [Crocinitomicaceae bacterium]